MNHRRLKTGRFEQYGRIWQIVYENYIKIAELSLRLLGSIFLIANYTALGISNIYLQTKQGSKNVWWVTNYFVPLHRQS